MAPSKAGNSLCSPSGVDDVERDVPQVGAHRIETLRIGFEDRLTQRNRNQRTEDDPIARIPYRKREDRLKAVQPRILVLGLRWWSLAGNDVVAMLGIGRSRTSLCFAAPARPCAMAGMQ